MSKKIPSPNKSGYTRQRQKMRYTVKAGAFVLLKKSFVFGLFKPRIVHSGAIINISLSGIKAQYTAATVWSSDFDKMSIVTGDNKIAIENIPCKIISDFKVSRLPDGTFVRRCGIEYGALADYHKVQLTYFMQEYTIDPDSQKPWHIEFA